MELSEKEELHISYSLFFKNKSSVLMIISLVLICIYQSFNTAIMAIVLTGYGIPDTHIGYVFATPCVTYIGATIFISFFIKKLPRRLFFFGSFIAVVCALFLMGPSPLLGIPPEDIRIIIFGWAFIGVAQAFIFIPIMPEIIESIQIEYQIVSGKN